MVNTSNLQSWQPRDTMGIMTDGTSNTLIVGEKHIPISRLESCPQDGQVWDCSILMTSGSWREYHVGRNIWWRLARSPQEWPDGRPSEDYGFGAYHPGTCNFLLGDGSVRGISTNVSNELMWNLGSCQDGIAVEMP